MKNNKDKSLRFLSHFIFAVFIRKSHNLERWSSQPISFVNLSFSFPLRQVLIHWVTVSWKLCTNKCQFISNCHVRKLFVDITHCLTLRSLSRGSIVCFFLLDKFSNEYPRMNESCLFSRGHHFFDCLVITLPFMLFWQVFNDAWTNNNTIK